MATRTAAIATPVVRPAISIIRRTRATKAACSGVGSGATVSVMQDSSSTNGQRLEVTVGGDEGSPRLDRVLAVLRRMARAGSPAETYGELVIDRASLIVRRDGREVSLTPTELRLLLVLSGLSLARTMQRTYEAAWQLAPRGLRGTAGGVAALTLSPSR